MLERLERVVGSLGFVRVRRPAQDQTMIVRCAPYAEAVAPSRAER
jgi:hypothetical protein